MELRHIKQFSILDGSNSNPSAGEDGKFPKWNNTSGYFEYSLVGDGDIDTSYFTAFVENIFNESSTDDYLVSVARKTGTFPNYAEFTMAGSATKYLPLGALAWEDTVEATLTLPGDTKVLFDDNDSIGGEDAFTYSKTSNKLQFEGTGLVFDLSGGTEGTYKEGLKYNGINSWSIGNSSTSINGGAYNTTIGYRAGQPLTTGSSRNIMLGPNAGELMASTGVGNIYIGSYAGRYGNTNNEFFLDNIDHSDTATAVADSFLYADLEVERRLYVRDRLAVSKEGKFGYSGLNDASGEYGMYQMSSISGGTPQWHDGSVWQDFANSTNTYLVAASYTTGDLNFLLSDGSTVGPVDITDVNTTTFATSPSSPSTGQTATSDYGYLQISNSSFTDNEGFTHITGLQWDNINKTLEIPGALQLSTTTNTYPNGSIYQDGTHGYIRLGGVDIQIDNDETPVIDPTTAISVGSGDVDWFKQKNSEGVLEFRSFNLLSYDPVYNPYNRLTQISIDDGDTILMGTTAERNRLSTTVDSPTTDRQIDKYAEDETLHIRALREGSNIVLTQTDNYIQIDATTGGTATLMTGSNLGDFDIFSSVNGVNFEFRGLTTTDSRIDFTQLTNDVQLDLDLTVVGNNLALASTPSPASNYAAMYVDTTDSDGIAPTLNFRQLMCDDGSLTIIENGDEVVLRGTGVTATGTNLGAGVAVYSTGTAPDFEFKTFNDEGTHILVDPNADGQTIDLIVDDISWTNTASAGTDVYLVEQSGTNSFNFTQRSLQGANGIEIQDNATVVVNLTKELVDFDWSTKTQAYSGGLLEFKVDYSDDIRSSATLVSTTIAELNIGAGLNYDLTTNTLSSVSGGGGTLDDYALRSIADVSTGTDYVFNFNINNDLGTDITVLPLTIPKYILPTAGYTPAAIGGVSISEHPITWELGSDMQHLSIDELTGELDIPQELVTYDAQNNLHDANNVVAGVNAKRATARANIGSAYVNGDSTEDFDADNLTVSSKLSAPATATRHEIGQLTIEDNSIQGNDSDVTVAAGQQNYDEDGARIVQTTLGTKVYLTDGFGKLEVFATDGGTSERLLVLDSNGNLFIKGNIYADGEIEAFSDDITV